MENTKKRERYGVGGVDEGLIIYGTRHVLPVASETPRGFEAMLGKQKSLTEHLAFVDQKLAYEKMQELFSLCFFGFSILK